MRRIQLDLGSDRHDAGRVNGIVCHVIMMLDVFEVDGRSDARLLKEVHQIALQVGIIENAPEAFLGLLKGTYGLAVVSARYPDVIVSARLGSPLVLGVGAVGAPVPPVVAVYQRRFAPVAVNCAAVAFSQ